MPEFVEKGDLFEWRLCITRDRELKASTRLILYTLSMHHPNIEVGQRGLALETGLSRKTVWEHLEKARAAGWITRLPQDKQEDIKTPDKYELNKRYYLQAPSVE